MTRIPSALSVILLAGVAMSTVQAATITVPGSLAVTEGDSDNGFPFSLDPHAVASMRYQQVYAASEFSGLPAVLITAIRFRTDVRGGPFVSVLPDIQIDLSTTSAAPGGLSTTFASNVGADNTTVLARGPLALSSTATGAAPHAFDIVITLGTPFLYVPGAGNLLLDVRNFGAGTTGQFDSLLSSAVTSRLFSSDVSSATGGESARALVTQFEYDAVSSPEPATILLSTLGLLAIVARRRVSGRRRNTL